MKNEEDAGLTTVRFTKMHGAGNDFVMIADMDESFGISGELISRLCDRHRGIGADGLILLRPDDEADFRMRYFNRDGGEAEMCGNGARCIAKFAWMEGIAGKKMRFATGAGPVEAELIGEDVRIAIGDVTGMRLDVDTDEGSMDGYAVCGVPHALLLVKDPDGWSRERFISTGSKVRHDKAFGTEGANFNLADVVSRRSIRFRTFERGVEDETLACGTGAVAISAICAAKGLVDMPVRLETSSGDLLEVDLTPSRDGASDCTLLGPAVAVFSGECARVPLGS